MSSVDNSTYILTGTISFLFLMAYLIIDVSTALMVFGPASHINGGGDIYISFVFLAPLAFIASCILSIAIIQIALQKNIFRHVFGVLLLFLNIGLFTIFLITKNDAVATMIFFYAPIAAPLVIVSIVLLVAKRKTFASGASDRRASR